MRVVQGRRAGGLRRLSGVPASLRGAALLPGAALVVHRLRYELAFGSHADQRLAAQGHAYLSSLTPWIVLLAALAVGGSLGRMASRAATSRADDARGSLLRVWVAATLALVAIYTGQELFEGLLATGHAGGLAGVIGSGGWLALPSAALIGGLRALALRVEAAVARLLGDAPLARLRWTATPLAWARVEVMTAPPAPLARAAAGRAPPRAVQLG
ncbi:MAG TPA: hypothetical protein VN635_11670 [Conexibacter sp.]|nr:hypothetical protein [Conexibacter sp.]